MSTFVVSTVSADGLVLSGAKPSPSTFITRFGTFDFPSVVFELLGKPVRQGISHRENFWACTGPSLNLA